MTSWNPPWRPASPTVHEIAETLLAALVLYGCHGDLRYGDEWMDVSDEVQTRAQSYACWEGWSRLEHRRPEDRS